MQDSAKRLDAGDAPEPYAIAASDSVKDVRPLVLKHGDGFAVFDGRGDIRPPGAEGVYYRDTRHLCCLVLLIERRPPLLLSSSLRDDNATLTCDLTNPDLTDDHGQMLLAHDLIHIRRSRFLWRTACFERINVRNFDDRRRRIEIAVEFAADFADLFEVRGFQREKRGVGHHPRVEEASVVLSYTGLDARLRTTTLMFDPKPTALDGDRACYMLDLDAGESRSIFIEIDSRQGPPADRAYRAYFLSLRDARRELRASMARAVTIQTSNDIFNEAASRAIADLYMLVTRLPEGPYPYAGIPWFSAVFGRDALITAMETLWLDPAIARGVLMHLAATQATAVDDASDAEPGKILHEARHGEMAELGEVPFGRYYGSVDSTPLFVMLAGAYLERTGDMDALRALWPNIEAALGWIERYGDRDGDGFVEYARRNRDGLVNQGWKDSHDAVFHEDGSMAQAPIALAEVQAYVYAAWRAAGDIARRLGREGQAPAFDRKAEALRVQFDRLFFDEALGTYVLALDGDKKPCRVRASNAGHALFTGIAFPERAASVVAALMGSSGFSGWGVRTVASTEARYNPMSYHNGSVWPHDNALIASGFARYGYRAEAGRVFEGLFSASTYVDLRRLPELLCGFPRKKGRGPTFYPVACIPQAWAAAAPLSLIQSCLGMTLDPSAPRITFTEPVLPPFLDWIVLKGLRVGGAVAEIGLWRSDRRVVVDVLDRQGAVSVVTTT
ncbi:glycogen debranching enzyme [Roseiarcus fermentans]|uniref:Glycogen debranching enzyme n=2 Tax=Roseiarcus fermentans TaxID=1473586 RepID=A0A366EVY8_9HYPH|nr:amylo-alpha-1,6-glucosidase [Roseiarcus fermentans]RBP05679.1 glycogen debranching enzyme [Roseiarcus fermentans]